LDPAPAVEALAALAGAGPALELAIGTGRVALPLAERGVQVHGIDVSEAMVERLRAKPGGDRIPVTIGDFADVAVVGRFSLVFVAFNTFFALASQQDQVRCFRNVAARLAEGGVFALEGFVPDVARFQRHQSVSAPRVELDVVMLDVSRHDPVAQRIDAQHVVINPAGIRLQPVHLRYAWPAELDLMAQLAGMRLRERWGDWERGPFTADSGRHVSVYELA
ncbi:MAG: class I SAM-dependent methyltransferase, partial [Actinomycetota bacterium]|nr:class I SAM-dependent methyltransferase [Actinomycetota bacterium]